MYMIHCQCPETISMTIAFLYWSNPLDHPHSIY